MDWGGFLQGVLEELTAHWLTWLFIVGVPALIAIAKKRSWVWAEAVTYGLVALAAILVIVNVGFPTSKIDSETRTEIPRVFSQEEADIIEKKLRIWLDLPDWTVTRESSSDAQFFRFKLIVAKTTSYVFLERESRFIFIAASVKPSSGFLSLPKKRQEALKQELTLNLLQTDVQYDLSKMPNHARFSDVVPYTDELTQYGFTKRLRVVGNAVKMAVLYLRVKPRT